MSNSNPYSPPDAPLVDDGTPPPYDAKYDGLGGWLILIGIGVVVTPFQALIHLITSSNQVFKQGTWEAVTTPGSEAYHPVWAPFLLTEIAFALLSFLVAVLTVFLYFGRKKAFPKWFIWAHVATLVVLIADVCMLQVVRPDLPFLMLKRARR